MNRKTRRHIVIDNPYSSRFLAKNFIRRVSNSESETNIQETIIQDSFEMENAYENYSVIFYNLRDIGVRKGYDKYRLR